MGDPEDRRIPVDWASLGLILSSKWWAREGPHRNKVEMISGMRPGSVSCERRSSFTHVQISSLQCRRCVAWCGEFVSGGLRTHSRAAGTKRG